MNCLDNFVVGFRHRCRVEKRISRSLEPLEHRQRQVRWISPVELLLVAFTVTPDSQSRWKDFLGKDLITVGWLVILETTHTIGVALLNVDVIDGDTVVPRSGCGASC